MYELQPARSPGKKLPETIPEIFVNSRGMSSIGRRVVKHARNIKKKVSGYLVPWGVIRLRTPLEPKLYLGAAFLCDRKALLSPVSSNMVSGKFLGLVDLGSSDSFIDSAFVSKNNLVSQSIEPCPLSLIDGTVNNLVNQIVMLLMRLPCGMSFLIKFFITSLDGSCEVVLGHNWLMVSNPQIDWKQGTLRVRRLERETIEEQCQQPVNVEQAPTPVLENP